LRVYTLTKEKLSSRVDRQSEKQRLDIGNICPSIFIGREGMHQVLDVVLFKIEIAYLVTSELGPQHVTSMLPSGAICGKLRIYQYCNKEVIAKRWQWLLTMP
jgi:hypothetical protein